MGESSVEPGGEEEIRDRLQSRFSNVLLRGYRGRVSISQAEDLLPSKQWWDDEEARGVNGSEGCGEGQEDRRDEGDGADSGFGGVDEAFGGCRGSLKEVLLVFHTTMLGIQL